MNRDYADGVEIGFVDPIFKTALNFTTTSPQRLKIGTPGIVKDGIPRIISSQIRFRPGLEVLLPLAMDSHHQILVARRETTTTNYPASNPSYPQMSSFFRVWTKLDEHPIISHNPMATRQTGFRVTAVIAVSN